MCTTHRMDCWAEHSLYMLKTSCIDLLLELLLPLTNKTLIEISITLTLSTLRWKKKNTQLLICLQRVLQKGQQCTWFLMRKHFFATDIIRIIFIFQGLITMHCEWITIKKIKHMEEKKICITIDQQKKIGMTIKNQWLHILDFLLNVFRRTFHSLQWNNYNLINETFQMQLLSEENDLARHFSPLKVTQTAQVHIAHNTNPVPSFTQAQSTKVTIIIACQRTTEIMHNDLYGLDQKKKGTWQDTV